MDQWLLQNEALIRISLFLGVFILLALIEMWRPRRVLQQPKGQRWLNHLLLVVFNSLLLRTALPLVAVGMAAYATTQGWGLLNQFELAAPWHFVLALLLLDLAIYWQHRLMHIVPILWRVHRVHHADPDFDVTTALRFHPLEILLSMGIKFAAIIAIGAPVIAVLVFEVLLNAVAMFNHSNIRLPLKLDRLLRYILVTPDMHRIHHSVYKQETNSNYGFNLPWWDYLFASYRNQPEAGHANMRVGIDGFSQAKDVIFLPGLLLLPWRKRRKL
jgi:sterol desaturase/sphingolipid hydroxylase (fatty acid hydroxylase superfamily)